MKMGRRLCQNVSNNSSCKETASLVLLLYNLHFCTRAYLVSLNTTHLILSEITDAICLQQCVCSTGQSGGTNT